VNPAELDARFLNHLPGHAARDLSHRRGRPMASRSIRRADKEIQ
jgi:hypothetical protein